MRNKTVFATLAVFFGAAGVAIQARRPRVEAVPKIAASPLDIQTVKERTQKTLDSQSKTVSDVRPSDKAISEREKIANQAAPLEEQLASLRTLDDQDLNRLAQEVNAELAAKDYTTSANSGALSEDERQHFASLMTKADAIGVAILERKVANAEKALEEASEQIASGKERQP